jgi:hypothetical protein
MPVPPPPENPNFKSEPPLKEVLVDLWENTEKLLRQEAALASAELDTKIKRLKVEVVTMAVGGAILYAGLLAAVAALILLLSLAVEPWLAALIVAGVAMLAGYMLLKREPKPSGETLMPERTIESVKKDVQAFTEISK